MHTALPEVLAENKDGIARKRLEEVGVQKQEPIMLRRKYYFHGPVRPYKTPFHDHP
jgi:hypothetical protein